jgi:hypothetical protein
MKLSEAWEGKSQGQPSVNSIPFHSISGPRGIGLKHALTTVEVLSQHMTASPQSVSGALSSILWPV